MVLVFIINVTTYISVYKITCILWSNDFVQILIHVTSYILKVPGKLRNCLGTIKLKLSNFDLYVTNYCPTLVVICKEFYCNLNNMLNAEILIKCN